MLTEFMSQLTNRQWGFSLIETLIAFMLVAVMGGAVVYILSQVVSINKSADSKAQATFYASQGLEEVRNYYQRELWLSLAGRDPVTADTNYTCYKVTNIEGVIGFLGTATDCGPFDTVNPTLKNENVNGGSFFYRQLGIRTTLASGKVEAFAIVRWVEKGKVNIAKVDTVFFNY